MTTTITIRWDERKAIEWALDEDGETQSALAARVGIDPGVLSRLLSGKRKGLGIDLLKRVAEAQNRPLSYYTETPTVHVMTSWGQWVERLIDDLPDLPRLKVA